MDPAKVLIRPSGLTLRINRFRKSAMYIFPGESKATFCGWFNDACVAAPPSPESPAFPLPATVLIVNVLISILGTRWFRESQKLIKPL